MKFCIGDRVSVLDDVLKGVVSELKGDVVFVTTDDGMLLKFDASELVKIGQEQYKISGFSKVDAQFLREKIAVSVKKKSLFKKAKNEVVMEVDLHVQKLVKSIKGLDNYDILTLQLDTAKKKIEYCISKKISKIVFIHGVGEGVLKTELHFLLNNYSVKYYDASYQKYGLGATEVYIYQNV